MFMFSFNMVPYNGAPIWAEKLKVTAAVSLEKQVSKASLNSYLD